MEKAIDLGAKRTTVNPLQNDHTPQSLLPSLIDVPQVVLDFTMLQMDGC